MPAEFYVIIEGERQGKIEGDAVRQHESGAIVGHSFRMGAHLPYEHGSGRVAGRRSFLPVTFAKAWDAASPLLFQAFVTNERLPHVRFEFIHAYRSGGDKEVVFYTILLRDALIVSLTSEIVAAPDDGSPYVETLALIFREIEVEHVNTRRSVADAWLPTDE